MRILFGLIAALLLLVSAGCARERTPVEIVGAVERVVDGDTIWLKGTTNKIVKVRMNKIDAPESDQPYGDRSTDLLRELVGGQTVRVVNMGTDKYGRTLGIVYRDGLEVNLEMVRRGLAWHYKYYDDTPAYAAAERTAKESRIGLWQDEKPISPYDWRHHVVDGSTTEGRHLLCPRCGAAMEICMSSSLGREFYVCQRRPICAGTRPYMDDDEPWLCPGCLSKDCAGCSTNEHWIARQGSVTYPAVLNKHLQ